MACVEVVDEGVERLAISRNSFRGSSPANK
jgi:hypothetical protein